MTDLAACARLIARVQCHHRAGLLSAAQLLRLIKAIIGEFR